MALSRFVYVIHIRTTPEKLWAALTDPKQIKRFWCETLWESDWRKGSPWRALIPDGRIADTGKVIETDPPRKLVISWRNEFRPELTAEGFTTCTYEITPTQDAVRLQLIHEIGIDNSKTISAVSQGWPALLSSLKSMLETGEPLPETTKWPEGV